MILSSSIALRQIACYPLQSTRPFSSILSSNALFENLRAVQEKRLSDPHQELERLKKDPEITSRLLYWNSSKSTDLFHRIAYGRAIEVYEHLKDTHYIFTHAQTNSFWLVSNIFKRVLLGKDLLEFEVALRHPVECLSFQDRQAKWYQRIRQDSLLRCSDEEYSTELLSADGYLSSDFYSESALSFFKVSFPQGYSSTQKRLSLTTLAEHYLAGSSTRQKFLEEFHQLDHSIEPQRYPTDQSTSNLYLICIPKEEFSSCGYLSHKFGVPVNLQEFPHFKNQTEETLLEKMQKEVSPSASWPQVRLLTNQLVALQDRTKTLAFSARPDADLHQIVNRVKILTEKYF